MVKKTGFIILLILFSFISVGCNNTDKKTVLVKNMGVKVNHQQRNKEDNSSVDNGSNTIQKVEENLNSVEATSNMNLQIKQVKKTGMIKNVYQDNGKRYLEFDEVEFFRDQDANDWTAENEAAKDGKNLETAPGLFDKDSSRLYDDYYIRNNDNSIATYEISPNVQILLCAYHFNIQNTIDLQETSYDKFIEIYSHIRLFNVYLENNVIVKIEEQYTP